MANDVIINVKADTAKAEKALSGFKNKLGNFAKAARPAALAIVGLSTAIAGFSLKTAIDFDKAMREVNTMLGLSEDQFTALGKEVRGVSKETGIGATEMAKALYQIVSAGVPAEHAIDTLRISAQAAVGGVTDAATAVDGITTVLNAFGLSADKTQEVADIMFTTVKGGKTNFAQLSAALYNVAPLAAAAGVNFDVVAAALATITKQGTPTTEATTYLRGAITAILKPTAEMETALAKAGYASGEMALKEDRLDVVLDKLRGTVGGSTEGLVTMFGRIQGAQAVLALTGENLETFEADLETMAHASDGAGAATGAFNEMQKSSAQQIAMATAQIKDMALGIGAALIPGLMKLVDKVTPVLTVMADWIGKNPILTVAILGVVGGLGALLLVLPMIINGVGALGAVMTVALGPIGLIALGIAGLIAVGILLWKNWDTVKAKAIDIFTSVKDFFVGVLDKITGIFREHWDKILLILFPTVGIPLLIARNWGEITEVVRDIGGKMVRGLWEGISSMTSWIWDKIKGFAAGIFDSIKEGLGKLWPGSPSEMGIEIGEGLTEGIGEGIENGISYVEDALDKVETVVKVSIDRLELAIGRFVATRMDILGWGLDTILATAQVRDELQKLASQIIGGSEALDWMAEQGYSVEKMLTTLRSMIREATDATADFERTIKTATIPAMDALETAIYHQVNAWTDLADSEIDRALAAAQMRKELRDLASQIVGGNEVLAIMAKQGYSVVEMLDRLASMIPKVTAPIQELNTTTWETMSYWEKLALTTREWEDANKGLAGSLDNVKDSLNDVKETAQETAEEIVKTTEEVTKASDAMADLFNIQAAQALKYPPFGGQVLPSDVGDQLTAMIKELLAVGWSLEHARVIARARLGLPEMQTGGIVPGPIGQPRLAIVHGGEQVSPPGGGINVTINNPVIYGEMDMRRVIVQAVRDHALAGGFHAVPGFAR